MDLSTANYRGSRLTFFFRLDSTDRRRNGETRRRGSICGSVMLRAGLVGLPSSGKTTLFQLLTSAREAPRTARQGRGERRRVARARRSARSIDGAVSAEEARAGHGGVRRHGGGPRRREVAASTSSRIATPTRCCTSCARFAIRRCRIRRARSIPRATARPIEDELILADLGVVERRLERLEKDLKKTPTRGSQERAGRRSCVRRASLDDGRALRTLGLSGDDARRLRGFQFLSAKPLLLVINLDEADARGGRHRRTSRRRSDVSRRHRRGARRRLREDRARDRAARSGGCAGVHGRSRAASSRASIA